MSDNSVDTRVVTASWDLRSPLVLALLLISCGGRVDGSGTNDSGTEADGPDTLASDAPSGEAGSCYLGHCLKVLAAGLDSPMALALDDANVYWVNGGISGSIAKVSRSGGTVTTLVPALVFPSNIAIAGGLLFYSDHATTEAKLMQIGVGGGIPSVRVRGVGRPPEIVVADTANVYWSDYQGIYSLALADGSVGTLVSSGKSVAPTSLALDGRSVYWGNSTGSPIAGTPIVSAIMKVPRGGGAPADLATLDGLVPVSLTVDALSAYWLGSPLRGASGGNGTVGTVRLDGTLATTLVIDLPNPLALAVDNTRVYWIDGTLGTLSSKPLAGGPVTVMAFGVASPGWMLVADGSIYWTANGSVRRLDLASTCRC